MTRAALLLLCLLSSRLNADALKDAGSLYKVGMHAEAMAAYEPLANDASQSDAVRAIAWQGVGNCALQLGDRNKARQAYDSSLQLNPHNTVLGNYVKKMWPIAATEAHAEAPASSEDSWAAAGLKSAMLPGWSQYARGETFKGKALGILAFGSWIFYAWSLSDANAKINKYEIYAAEAKTLKDSGQSYDAYRPDGAYREANVALLANQIAMGTLITVYGYSIWDAVRGTPSVKKSMFSAVPRGDGVQVAIVRHF